MKNVKNVKEGLEIIGKAIQTLPENVKKKEPIKSIDKLVKTYLNSPVLLSSSVAPVSVKEKRAEIKEFSELISRKLSFLPPDIVKKIKEKIKDSIPTQGVREYLGPITPQAVLKRKDLICFKYKNRYYFPRFQFELLDKGLSKILRKLNTTSSLMKMVFLFSPSPYLKGKSPYEVIKRGKREEIEIVKQLAESYMEQGGY